MKVVLLLAVALAGCAAPRPSADIRSGSFPEAATIQPRTGAPQGSSLGLGVSTSEPVSGGTATGAAPHETGGIGQPASYCKPGYCETPEPVAADGIAGQATWWNSFGPGIYTALRPDLGSKGDLVIVCGGEPFHCVTAPVITSCACLGPNSDRLVDLSADLFREFAPLSAGVVRITLQVVSK